MTPERHARVREIFLQACEREAGKQAEFLDQACAGDDALRAEVESLLTYLQDPTLSTAAADSPAADRFMPGALLAGRYRIVSLVGRGAMGEVYRADDLQLGHPVALKFLPSSLARHPAWLARLRNEVRMAREVSHPNVCRVHDIGTYEAEHFLSMEYVDGEDLASLLHRIGRLPDAKAVDVARQLCSGLAAAHARGVLHRDLKPSNVMMDGQGQVRITDFGIAASADRPDAFSKGAGTPRYMAPEVLAGGASSIRSDLYALGLVLHEMFTGRLPSDAAGGVQATQDGKENTREVMDPGVEQVIQSCLHPDAAARPSSALAVAAALPGSDLLAGLLAAGQIPPAEIVASAGDSRPLDWRTAGLLLTLAAAAMATVVWLAGRAFPLQQASVVRPPEALAARAQEIVQALGYSGPLRDRAFGFEDDTPEGATRASVVFWYREALEALVPADARNILLDTGRVRPHDPPMSEEGMVLALLDMEGRLVSFQAVPPVEDPSPATPSAVDWTPAFGAAGLDAGVFHARQPRVTPAVYADVRAAWEGPGPQAKTISIEAAAYRGRPVFFEVQRPKAGPREGMPRNPLRMMQATRFSDFALLALLAVAIPLARRNLLRQSGHRAGALRLALVVFLMRMGSWLLQATHGGDAGAAMEAALIALAAALGEAVEVWVLYMALEPYVRRLWPQTLISWNRLLAGRLRDPLVGHHLLAGAVAGAGWTLLLQVDILAPPLFGLNQPFPFLEPAVLDSLLGARVGLGLTADLLLAGLYTGLLCQLLLAMLRVIVPHLLAAAGLFILLHTPFAALEGSHLGISIVTLGLGYAGILVLLLSRYGLVAAASALFVQGVLTSFPIGAAPSVWYWDIALFGLLLAGATAVYGYATARWGTSTWRVHAHL